MDASANTLPSLAAHEDSSRGSKRALADDYTSSASSPPPAKRRFFAYTIFRSSSLPTAKLARTDPTAAEMNQTELSGTPQRSQESSATSGATMTEAGPMATSTTTTTAVPGAARGHRHSPGVAQDATIPAAGPAMTNTNTSTNTTTTSNLPPSPDLITPPKSTPPTPEDHQTQKQQLPARPPRIPHFHRHSVQHRLCSLYAPERTPEVVLRATPDDDEQYREIETLLFNGTVEQLAWESRHQPNGTALATPSFFQRDRRLFPERPVAWIKDWETGRVRPRRMVDDFREVREERRRREEGEVKNGGEEDEEDGEESEDEDEEEE